MPKDILERFDMEIIFFFLLNRIFEVNSPMTPGTKLSMEDGGKVENPTSHKKLIKRVSCTSTAIQPGMQ